MAIQLKQEPILVLKIIFTFNFFLVLIRRPSYHYLVQMTVALQYQGLFPSAALLDLRVLKLMSHKIHVNAANGAWK